MRYAPYAAFFLSGASSLIFQTIWTRMLHHVFGVTSVAISTVLAVFMAGLGIGNWVAGKYANRIKHPIFAYAFAELGVALWSLVIPFLVASDGWLATVNATLRQSFGAESGVFMIARFLCVVPILLIPTTLMGASTPLLVRHFVSTSDDSATASGKVGFLYALNTFGAATGPILSAFILMPHVGLSVTNIVACSMNFSLALLIFALRKHLGKRREDLGLAIPSVCQVHARQWHCDCDHRRRRHLWHRVPARFHHLARRELRLRLGPAHRWPRRLWRRARRHDHVVLRECART